MTMPSSDPFRQAFQRLVGRPITEAEYNDNAFLATLSNDLFILLPIERQATFSAGGRLIALDNLHLNAVIAEILRTNPSGLSAFPGSRLAQFPIEAINGFIAHLDRNDPQGALVKELRAAVTSAGGAPPAAPTPAPAPPTGGPGLTPPPEQPAPSATSAEAIPADLAHQFILEVGAAEWAHNLRAQGVEWEDITIERLRADMKNLWAERKNDPKYSQAYKYAQQYYLNSPTNSWPTPFEYNQYLQKAKNVPYLSPDGKSFIPKDGEREEGDYPKWEVPTAADGSPVPLPHNYEWRFSADGTPIPYFTGTAEQRDVLAGWYLDPKSGKWSYNPLLGAADYLSGGDTRWTDLLGGYAAHTGRLPDLDMARQLAMTLWQGASPDAQARAAQFAQANGFWPTPFELEYGAAGDTDANGTTGAAGQAGLGQVPVFVPGIGVVLTQGQAVGAGGYVFDPMSGIPGAVRPWVREILNGRTTLDQVPPEVRDWAIFSLAQFKEQLPVKRQEELKLAGAFPVSPLQPTTTPFGAPMPVALMDEPLNRGAFLTAWKQLLPGQPEPTAAQMNDVAFLSTIDSRITQHLSSSMLRKFPLEALSVFGNEVLLKVVPDVIAKFPTERQMQFGKGDLENLITDPTQRANLGLLQPAATPSATTAATAPRAAEGVTQPVPAQKSAQFTPPPPSTSQAAAPSIRPLTPLLSPPSMEWSQAAASSPLPLTSLLSPPGMEGQAPPTSSLAPPVGLTPPLEETEEERKRRLGLVTVNA